MRFSLFVVCVFAAWRLTAAKLGICRKVDSCSCRYDDGALLSLHPLSRNDGYPRFENVEDEFGSSNISWNPCRPFTYSGTPCTNVDLCVERDGSPYPTFLNLGYDESAEFIHGDDDSLTLVYTSDQGFFKTRAEITLQCLYDSKFDFIVNEGNHVDESGTLVFNMTLASNYACAQSILTTEEPEVPTTEPSRPCVQIDSCSCRFPDGTVLSLASLARTDGHPAFERIPADNGELVSWNPCYPFSSDRGIPCQDVAICVENYTEPYTQYGFKDYTASIEFDRFGYMALTYTTYVWPYDRKASIALRCSPGAVTDYLIPESEHLIGLTKVYDMTLVSNHACIVSGTTEPATKPHYTTEPATTEPPPFTHEFTTPPRYITTPQDTCRQTDRCSCQFNDGRTLSLEAVSRADGTPYFENVADKYGDLVSWNPCSTFTFDGTDCVDAYLCIAVPDQETGHVSFQRIAAERGVTFSADENGDQVITYHTWDTRGFYLVDAEITLQCLEESTTNFFLADGKPTWIGETGVYKMTLASKFACAMPLESLKGRNLLP